MIKVIKEFYLNQGLESTEKRIIMFITDLAFGVSL